MLRLLPGAHAGGLLVTAMLAPGVALGSAFQVLEHSPARLGTAYAGTASIAEDATTAFFNPAGMTQLENPELAGAVHFIRPVAGFRNRRSAAAAGTAVQQPLSGPDRGTEAATPTPSLYFVHPLNQKWRLGIGLTFPFGLVSEYDEDWVGRYHATDSELRVININPVVAYRLTERLSVGLGLSYQRAEVTLESQVDAFNACIRAGGAVPQCDIAHGGPANPAADSSTRIKGNDSDIVADLSLHWRPTDDIRIGVLWRQGADYRLEGSADFDRSASCTRDSFCDAALGALAGGVSAKAAFPDTVTLSASLRVTERWQVHADVAWSQWQSLQSIEIINKANQLPVSILELGYDNTMRYSAGASLRGGEQWTWRFGLAFDEAPQSAARFQTARIPDADRTWATFGFNYRLRDNVSVDIGYAHLFVDDSSIDSRKQGNRLSGDFESHVDILGVQGTWRF